MVVPSSVVPSIRGHLRTGTAAAVVARGVLFPAEPAELVAATAGHVVAPLRPFDDRAATRAAAGVVGLGPGRHNVLLHRVA